MKKVDTYIDAMKALMQYGANTKSKICLKEVIFAGEDQISSKTNSRLKRLAEIHNTKKWAIEYGFTIEYVFQFKKTHRITFRCIPDEQLMLC